MAFTETLGDAGAAWRQKYARAPDMLVPLCTAGALESPDMDVLLQDAGLRHHPCAAIILSFPRPAPMWTDSRSRPSAHGWSHQRSSPGRSKE